MTEKEKFPLKIACFTAMEILKAVFCVMKIPIGGLPFLFWEEFCSS